MKKNKLEKYESKVRSEPSPEQIEQSKQAFVNLLTPIIEKMLRSPETIRPVSESFAELARQAKTSVIRQPTIIDSGENSAQNVTKIISGNDENSPKIVTQIYTDDEIKILNSLK